MYQDYRAKLREIADINYATALLHWDQEVYMPEKGADMRAQQIATLSGIAHDMMTSDEIGKMLEHLIEDSSLSEREMANVRESKKDWDQAHKYTREFVMKRSRAVSEAYQAWIKARKANDFKVFEPALANMVDLKREEAQILGYEDHPYDALLDLYEPKAKTAEITALFDDVRSKLLPLLDAIKAAPQVDDSMMRQHFDHQKQWDFGLHLLEQMGYDFTAGRQDLSAHPFTINFSANDVRVTTRVDDEDFNNMCWSCIHEGGHALYEQGLDADDYGLPTGSSVSLGIHESQSRLWENNVGRSKAYWKANYGRLQQDFPNALGSVSMDAFYKAMNKVQPSLIRTESDELTYHFHIMIRFEIEKALVEGSLEVSEARNYWNDKYKQYLGVDVPNDNKGIIQDIHWSHGSMGYFPTYSIGSFYAAQFFRQAEKDIPGLEEQIASGNMKPLLGWLRDNIHRYGRMYSPAELCKRVTGETLNFQYFMDYASKKFRAIYGL